LITCLLHFADHIVYAAFAASRYFAYNADTHLFSLVG